MHDQQTTPAPEISTDAAVLVSEEKARFRRRLRRVSLTVILIVIAGHVLVGIGAAFWVVARYFSKPAAVFVATKQIEMKPEQRKNRPELAKLESMRPKPHLNNRIQSLKPTTLALPDLPKTPVNAMVPLDTGAIVTGQLDGLGQFGSGNGQGDGFFGGSGKAGKGLLEGQLYDLKQTKAGKDTNMNPGGFDKLMFEFGKKGESLLQSYFVAPTKLYLASVAIPVLKADTAPTEFKVQDQVKPKMWVAVYKGKVIAPDTGRFQFLGHADDQLLVWFNRRLVFDGSIHKASDLTGKPGVEFSVQKGNSYDIMIAIAESPGGYFHAWLQIQKLGDKELKPYWFRVTSTPTRDVTQNTLRYDGKYQIPPTTQVDGLVWKSLPTGGLSPLGGF